MIASGYAGKVSAAIGAIVLALAVAVVSSPRAIGDPVTPQEADADQAIAYQVVNDYWTRHWPENFTGVYVPPHVAGLYDSHFRPLPCDGSLWTSDNAWYCASTDSVGFDLNFMRRVYDLGDSFIYLVVAHEWGHAIQARLNPDIQSVRRELQADCLAGAALFGSARDQTLRFESGDVDELNKSLTNVADKYPWTNIGDHGSPAERIANFSTGASGPQACLPELPPHLRAQPPDPGIPPPPPPGTF